MIKWFCASKNSVYKVKFLGHILMQIPPNRLPIPIEIVNFIRALCLHVLFCDWHR